MSTRYTITCHSMAEKDVALLKSLLGIVGQVAGADWEWRDSVPADVVIIDTDHARVGSLQDPRPRVIVTYVSPDKTLVPNTIALGKPARARDLMDALTRVHARLGA